MKTKSSNKGFSLVEVMVALLVLALGILGISKLQSILIQNASDANHRSVAISLAQAKIDDLRSFNLPEEFFAIANDSGGKSDELIATENAFSLEREPYRFSLKWEVTDYFHVASDTFEVPVTGTPGDGTVPLTSKPAFKLVDVFVGWLDETNNLNEIHLETVIDSYPPALAMMNDKSNFGGGGPKASYQPEPAPDVIDIRVRDEIESEDGVVTAALFRQTSKPVPQVFIKKGKNGFTNTAVSFDVVTYRQDTVDINEFIQLRREEYVTVKCQCQSQEGAVLGFEPAFSVWDGKERFPFVRPTNLTSYAVPVDNAIDPNITQWCTACCRDNYVVSGRDGIYADSCRLKRVDGIMRVFEDWNLRDLVIIPRQSLTDPNVQASYSDCVTSFISDGECAPSVDPNFTVLTANVPSQLQARGIYIDKVYDYESALIGNKVEITTSELLAETEAEYGTSEVAYAEVNLSLLADWCNDPDADQISWCTGNPAVKVTNEDFVTYGEKTVVDLSEEGFNIYDNNMLRGYVDWVSGMADSIANPEINVQDIYARIETSNSGITNVCHSRENNDCPISLVDTDFMMDGINID